MNPMERHPSMYQRPVVTRPAAQVGLVVHEQDAGPLADCCSARPVFLVVLPATGQRPHPAELLLCGHHRRASRAGLNAVHAAVYDLSGAVG